MSEVRQNPEGQGYLLLPSASFKIQFDRVSGTLYEILAGLYGDYGESMVVGEEKKVLL